MEREAKYYEDGFTCILEFITGLLQIRLDRVIL